MNVQKSGTTEEALANAEKIGFNTGLFALHPLDKKNKLPIYIANFVLMDYGTGAIFGCPAHDQRDLDFANKYKLNVLPVVKPKKKLIQKSLKLIMKLIQKMEYYLILNFLNNLNSK